MIFKNRKLTIFFAGLGMLGVLASCSQLKYEKLENGVVVSLNKKENTEAALVKLEVVSDEIIRVSSTPENSFSARESLVVLPQSITTDYTVEENQDQVTLSTASMKAKVSLSTGEVSFYDLNGQVLLKEAEGVSKGFTPIEADGFKGYSFQQVFDSPDDEAFYGLGQHQSDEWNYKGKNEELYQYNTKVSIPFVVSNKNYGILWDNYSLTRFGNPCDYGQLSQFKLYNKEGKEGALTATYTTGKGEEFAKRDEADIDYENLETVKKFPADFPFNNSKIVWEGEIEAKESGIYHFKLYYAGYTSVSIGGKEVVGERWRTAWNPNTYKFTVELKKGERVPIKLDWKPDGGISYVSLKALSPRPTEEQGKLALWSEMGQELDYYFIHGDNMDKVISGYRQLTGKATILPRWAYGFWQSRERYKTQKEVVGTLAEFRKRKIPIDNIVIDWSYWEEDQWGSHKFDASRFPDPQKMMDDIHAMNGHAMISVWPKFYTNTDNYKELDAKGFMYQQAVKDSVRDWIGKGHIGSFYDPYCKEARQLFWNQMKSNIYDLGMDAWWMDASEPDIVSNSSMEYRKKLMTPTAIGSSTEFFNTYALMNAKAIYNGQRSVDPNKRVFLLTRSGFAGLQRYSTATWSGDIGTRWEDMKAQITAGMNFAISGIPYWTMDIGGFCVEKRYEKAKEGSEDLKEWRELNTRWYQFGSFVPLFRAHGQYPYREIYNIAPKSHKAYQSILYYNKLRYRLMPYIYSLAGHVYFDDYTIMRALVMDFTKDTKVNDIDDQYMFGPSIMVCPVSKFKARERQVYLPEGSDWYDAYNGSLLKGGQTINADAPYEKMPLFVKAGSILPVGPEIEYTSQKLNAPIKLVIYTGADAQFELYEDEGLNFNYEKGKYSTISIKWSENDQKLTIGERKGEFEGMPQERIFTIVFASETNKVDFNFDDHKGKEVKYNGKLVQVEL
ncbi:TIM-barrel domain-containing protein [Labilibaculum euxinus]|nr:TIM-barrel domain-containing protein [Labilibaculum euxinus]